MNTAFTSRENELCVIGAMLQDARAASMHSALREADFSDPVLGLAFNAVRALSLRRKPVDLATVDTEMGKAFGGSNIHTEVLVEAIQSTPSASNVKAYIAAVRDTSLRRQLADVARQMYTLASDTMQPTEAALESSRNLLRALSGGKASWVSMADVLAETYAKIEQRKTGGAPLIPTGIPAFDRAFGGIEKGEYVIVGARPSVGKSALGAHVALSAARNGYKVGVISREMTADQYGSRFLSSVSLVPGSKLRRADITDTDFLALADAMGGLSGLPVSFLFSVKSVELLRMEVQRLVDSSGLDLLVVDYLQLLTSEEKAQKDYRRIGLISGALRDITRDYGIPVIALAQLSRPPKGSRSVPQLSDLRESGDIEQDADVVILMHRCDDADDPGVLDADKHSFESLTANGARQYILLYVAKGRQSGTGQLAVLFNPEIMRYSAIER